MVKGISRQVIVVHPSEPQLFEQAIFILKDKAVADGGITDDALLREAKRLMGNHKVKRRPLAYGPLWAFGGAVTTGLIWFISTLI